MKDAPIETAPPDYTEEIAGIISLQLYDPAACRAIIEQAKAAAGWVAAEVHDEAGGPHASTKLPVYRSAQALVFDDRSPDGRDFEAKLNYRIKPLVKRVWRADLKMHVATQLVRYAPGDHYVAHVDTIPGDANYRYFTVLCYLNEDFAGGRTDFPVHNHSVAPRAGRALIFPSTYLHRAAPVMEGEKFVIVTWLCGAPPVSWF